MLSQPVSGDRPAIYHPLFNYKLPLPAMLKCFVDMKIDFDSKSRKPWAQFFCIVTENLSTHLSTEPVVVGVSRRHGHGQQGAQHSRDRLRRHRRGRKKRKEGHLLVFFLPFYISSAIHLLATQGAKHQIHKGAAIQGVAFSSPAVVQRSDSGG